MLPITMLIAIASALAGLGSTQSTQKPILVSLSPISTVPSVSVSASASALGSSLVGGGSVLTSLPEPVTTAYNVCLTIVNSALQTLNSTFEIQSSLMNLPFDLSLLPNDCFYLAPAETTCRSFPTGLSDMFSSMLWVTQLIQRCQIPGSWVGYPSTFNALDQGVRQFQASISSGNSGRPTGSLGVSGSVAGTGAGLGVSVGTNGYGQSYGQGYGQGSLTSAGATGTPIMMVPVQTGAAIAATPPNPFSTMMSIIGSSVGPQGITISPATIAGILSLINQVVGIAVQLAPIGGAVAGPLLGAALG